MSFLLELTTIFKKTGTVVPEDFIVYDDMADRINLQVKNLVKYFDRFGLDLNPMDIDVNYGNDSIEFKATPQLHGGELSQRAQDIMETEMKENNFIDFFSYESNTNKFRMDFLKEIELY